MIVQDAIYASAEIDEPVLIDLINAPTVTRLRDVSQRGYPAFVNSAMPVHYSRYEHSVGCMLLLRRLGAGLEEQIAGLLHDVSHTAFSHVIDWAIGDPTKEDYQDRILRQYINASELPGILASHGYDSSKISEMEEADHFGLLERAAPQLCADRIDYTLRDMHYSMHRRTKPFLQHLTVYNGHIAFDSYDMALGFARAYASCQRRIWASPDNVVRYYLIAQMIKKAIEKGAITSADFHCTETEFIKKLRGSGAELQGLAEAAFGSLNYRISRSGISIAKKFRHIDPEYVQEGRMMRVSEANPAYIRKLRAQGLKEAKGLCVEIGGE